ncbi:MAG: hypothetical protein ACI84O_000083 [Myxococcota bacterium]|jgi:hypothetical protein
MQQGWYYVQNHKQQGPVDLVELQRMLKSRVLAFDTLVWHQSLSKWEAAKSLSVFKLQPTVIEVEPEVIDTPPPPRPRPPSDGGYVPQKKRRPLDINLSGHPWRRYFSRSIDSMLMVFILPVIPPNPAVLLDYRFSIATAIAAMLLHAALQSTWGSTPGKALMQYSVRNPNGSKLSFEQALRREFKILFHGLGFGIPFLSTFTQLSAYNRLKRTGTTSWDKDGGFIVNHR